MGKTEVSGVVADVSSLDFEGRGVAKIGGKTVFVKGAMPSEKVVCRIVKSKKQFDEAETVEVLRASGERVEPECRYFDTCGGCALQHIAPQSQVAFKQRIVEEQLARIGKVVPQRVLPPIYGAAWHYRSRARLSVEVDKAGRLKMGFHEKKTNDVVDIRSCKLLPVHISGCLPQVGDLLRRLVGAAQQVGFVEFYFGQELTVLNIKLNNSPSETVRNIIKEWFDSTLAGVAEKWQIWLQCGKEKSCVFYPDGNMVLKYVLPEFDVEMPYRPGDFTQVNAEMNAVMVSRALGMLDIRPGERVADLFCGLGNFSLPMAKCGAEVLGIEGSETLVAQAAQNAVVNKCRQSAAFLAADLFEIGETDAAAWGKFDKMLLDPPRSGAYAVVKSLHAPYLPKKIVYVSCNPATLARDAAVLVEKGYIFKEVGVMNMFSQTAHAEAVALFEL
ncbi:23S rRNA (uracil(1939)-C(5))-methyltransferase RlmD [Neisseria chenwenguii]|uniref:23S rRNA (uracil(1939)-C(5))-methyltransferase RlmD n=1 Tax=Neisseria chenwenguii TaxID=1853278 RepID=A0A220S0E7_9NEIS|nr:23S rRNA (uracil(1939)-C(5))-methyltransferase RlmD [Neisseria chenwenguii]ASK26934.1 23S rRNA (uracil(1939)-C(5))-methyltransferase [Neisseria chenwenguii]ROV56734.1 23S rRNA (uracil(1939)-C(5))-methyltransferase RlmD [Neisseria chenwenguii]